MKPPRRLAGWVLIVSIAGCVTTPPEPAPPPAPVVREEPAPTPAPPPCNCDQPAREIARLKHDLASRDAEIRDLRAEQREQLKVLRESSRQVARTTLKLHQRATQADAASYVAEVELDLQSLRSSPGDKAGSSLAAVARDTLQSASASFAAGDYAAAMDRAAQAQQLIAMLRTNGAETVPTSTEVLFQLPVPLRVTIDSNLRRQPRRTAKIVGVLKESTAVVAQGFNGHWMRVAADDGRLGWVHQSLLGKR